MKSFLKEFKDFISKGNVIDMAVGIIIGGAFSTIVTSLVDDIINPLLGLLGGKNFDQYCLVLNGDATVYYGKFITAIISFLIMALVIFIIIKLMNVASSKIIPKKEEEKTTKKCPFCQSEISIKATRCPHCTSELELDEEVTE